MNSCKNIPNLFVIGAPKAGTTSVVASLKEHPEIFVPKEKEPRYFDAHTFFDFKEDYPITNIDEYLEKYNTDESLTSKYRVDGSVFNMYSLESINNILSISPNAKFLIIIREPLSAVKSMYSQRMKYIIPQLREISEDFDECWMLSKERQNGKNFPKGCRNKFIFRYDLLYSYEKYLPRLFQSINKKNLYIASYKQFKDSPDDFYTDILDFLSLDKLHQMKNEKKNISYIQQTNRFTRVLGLLAFKTYKIRKKIGLSGSSVSLIRNILYKRNTTPPKMSNKSDSDIKNYFKKTYEYLNSINCKY